MYVARNSSGVRPIAAIGARYFARCEAGSSSDGRHVEQLGAALEQPDVEVRRRAGRGRASRPGSRGCCGPSGRAGLLAMRIASPSQLNQIGMRWGTPSGRTVLIQTTGSLRRSRSMRSAGASAGVASMPGSSQPGGPRSADRRQPRPWDVCRTRLRQASRAWIAGISAARSRVRRRSPPRPRPRPASPGSDTARAGRIGFSLELPLPGPEPLEQPPAGQVEVDRRDRDPAIDDGVEVRARDRQPRRRRAADPEVGDARADRAARSAGPGRPAGRAA